jgi:hypothetical protein
MTVAIGEITRQLAKQAIDSSVKDVIDSVTGASKPAPSATPPADQPLGALILGQVQAMQKAVKEDEELAVLCQAGDSALRVLEIFVPAWGVAVLTGIDVDRVVTRVITPIEELQLVCKVMKLAPGAKATAVRIIGPKLGA